MSNIPHEMDVKEGPWNNFRLIDLNTEDEELNKLLPESELPFEKVTIPSEEEEEECCIVSKIQTVSAWAVEIPDPRKTAEMIKWLKETGLEHPSLKHAKHIRKWMDPHTDSTTALLLSPLDEPPPLIPNGLTPFVVEIPRFPARTLEQVKAKSAIWPVFYEAQNHKELREEAQRWTYATVAWFCEAVKIIKREAKRVKLLGEFPIVSYVPVPLDAPPGSRSFVAHDTRLSSQHPLRHSIFNLVRQMGDAAEAPDSSQIKQSYLLTSLTLFTTHEPCIACSMALVHSRVKEVVYLYPMPLTGGCGSLTSVSGLKNVNHRYQIWRWREVPMGSGGIEADVDA
ncbi:cytidine deaminase-like protein [Hysterangium stoloniferum]|nr:cytidine deaminase-like protein [Hysterangium stoloniferum]